MLGLERNANRLWVSLLCFLFIGSATTTRADDQPPDHTALGKMLESMGYKFKEQQFDNSDTKYYDVTVRYKDIDHKIMATAYPGEKLIFIHINLMAPIPKATKIPEEILVGMLNANFDTTTAFFSFETSTRQIRLNSAIPSTGLKPATLREAVDELLSRTQQTGKLWDPADWQADSKSDAKGTASTKLDHDSLKTVLEDLGYEFTTKRFEANGLPYYTVAEKRPERTCYVDVQLSPGKSTVWVTANFSKGPAGREVPLRILRRMLEINFESAHMRFAISPKTRMLRLEHSFDNDNLTPEIVGKAIQRACDMIVRHVDVWDFNSWPASESPRSTPSKAKDAEKEKVEGAAEASKEAE